MRLKFDFALLSVFFGGDFFCAEIAKKLSISDEFFQDFPSNFDSMFSFRNSLFY